MADARSVSPIVRLIQSLGKEKIRFQLVGMSAAILQGVIVTTLDAARSWLPDMDLNHDKQIQSLLCYHYTIGQPGVLEKVRNLPAESRR